MTTKETRTVEAEIFRILTGDTACVCSELAQNDFNAVCPACGRPEAPRYTSDANHAVRLFEHRLLTAQILSCLPRDAKARPDLSCLQGDGWALEFYCTVEGKPVYASTACEAVCKAFLEAAAKRGL